MGKVVSLLPECFGSISFSNPIMSSFDFLLENLSECTKCKFREACKKKEDREEG